METWVFFFSGFLPEISLKRQRADWWLFRRFLSNTSVCNLLWLSEFHVQTSCSHSALENPFISLWFKKLLLLRRFCVCVCVEMHLTHTKMHRLHGWSCLLYSLQFCHLAFASNQWISMRRRSARSRDVVKRLYCSSSSAVQLLFELCCSFTSCVLYEILDW